MFFVQTNYKFLTIFLYSKIKKIDVPDDDENKENIIKESNLIAKVSQITRKFLLPKMANLHTSTIYIGLRITNFLTPHLFYILYKHSFIEKMLFNIDLLSSSLMTKTKDASSTAVIKYSEDNLSNVICTDENLQLEVGDFVIAPLNIERFNAISYLVADYSISTYKFDKYQTIMARAEIVSISHYNYKPMVSYFWFYIISIVSVNY